MMNEQQRAAMEQALEALAASDDFLFNYHDCEPDNEREMDAYSEIRANNHEAFTAMTAALEQPRGEATLAPVPEAHKQEPVAMQMDVIVVNLVREGINKHRARELAEHFIKHTRPPAREWVGLTDTEKYALADDVARRGVPIFEAICEAEAKLREKNT